MQGHFRVCFWILGKIQIRGSRISCWPIFEGTWTKPKKIRIQNPFRWLLNVITQIYIPHDPHFLQISECFRRKSTWRRGRIGPIPPVLIGLKKPRHNLILQHTDKGVYNKILCRPRSPRLLCFLWSFSTPTPHSIWLNCSTVLGFIFQNCSSILYFVWMKCSATLLFIWRDNSTLGPKISKMTPKSSQNQK